MSTGSGAIRRGVTRLLQSLARHVSTHATDSALAADTGGDSGPLRDDTVREYLGALKRLMVVDDQSEPAWAPYLRSRARLRVSRKRHDVDPSLAVAALAASPERILADPNYLGFLFESLVIRDLRVHAQALEGRVLHHRDGGGLEADAIVELPDDRWAAFEVKLGVAQTDAAASSLTRLSTRVDTSRCGAPALLAVIVGTGSGCTRPDGVAVIPIGALGP